MANKSIPVLIADAQYLIRTGLQALIAQQSDMEVVATATHSSQLALQLPATNSAIVLMDYGSEGGFNPEDIGEIQEQHPDSQVVVISSDLQQEKVLRALSLGARGFLTKYCDDTEILEAIRAAAEGKKFFCQTVLDIILQKDDTDPSCEPVQLSVRELEVIRLMADGLKAQAIAQELHLSIHTVYTHRKNILRKLGAQNAAEVIRYAYQAQLVE